MQFLWIGLGGFLGANARYLVQQAAASRWGTSFPYGTLIANVLGSFIIAFFLTLAVERLSISTEMRLFVAVGFLGGFTTFSSYAYETFLLFEQGRGLAAGLNLLTNLVVGMSFVVLGVVLARMLQGIGG